MYGPTSIYYFLAAFSAAAMTLISALKYLERRSNPFLNLSHFLTIFFISISAALALKTKAPALLSLSALAWIFIYESCANLLRRTTSIQLSTKGAHKLIIVSLLLSGVLQITGYGFSWVITPLALCIAYFGLGLIIQLYKLSTGIKFSLLHHLNFLALLAFFISRALVPWITAEYSFEAVIKLDCLFLIFFGQSLYPLLGSEIFEKHEKLLKNALEARNQQLFNHTHFSEFKILSAGVVHEINNALTIINVKIEQMLRIKHDPGQEKDLRLILTNANRINKSVKGLREFIYPQDSWENIEMEELFRHIHLLYGQRLKNHDVKLTLKGIKGKHINGNRIQIEQVFLSLLNHSVETLDTLEEKWIEITGSKQRGCLEMIFNDSGPDLCPKVVKMINSKEITLEDDVNQGIRLIQAKKIIENHGGTIEYVMKSGNLVCKIRLPLSFQSEKSYPTSKFESARDLNSLH